jgi:hypothetical protein
MTIENLPRPWMLAALTGIEIEQLVGAQADRLPEVRSRPPAPRRPRDLVKEYRRDRLREHRPG